MKRIIHIEPLDEYESANFYTIRFNDEEDSEFDKFFSKFDGIPEYESDFNVIISYLNKIGEQGVIDRYFRPEGGRVIALPIYSNKLRLYCFKISECVLLIGNGAHKEVEKVQDSEELSKYVSDLRITGKYLLSRIESDKYDTCIHNCTLYGNLEFSIETTE